MSRRRLAAFVLLPLLVSPVACSDDGDDPEVSTSVSSGAGTEDTTGDTTGETVTVETTAVDDPADPGEVDDQTRVDLALEALVEQFDAAGFVANPDDDEDDSDFEFESEECAAFEEVFSGDELPGQSASAESGEYERGELGPGSALETVEVNVGLVDDPARIDEVFAVFADERLAPCMEEALRTTFAELSAESAATDGPEITVQELTVEPLAPSGVGDGTAGLAMRGVLATSGIEIPLVLELEFGRAGRAVAMVMVGIIGADQLTVDRAAFLGAAVAAIAAPG